MSTYADAASLSVPDRSGSGIDHLNIAVPDLAAAVAFYQPVLASLGIAKMNMHLAFTVDTREAVDTFYATALDAGATPLEQPAVHTQDHDDYYGGFVLDLHGINLEAVCHHRP